MTNTKRATNIVLLAFEVLVLVAASTKVVLLMRMFFDSPPVGDDCWWGFFLMQVHKVGDVFTVTGRTRHFVNAMVAGLYHLLGNQDKTFFILMCVPAVMIITFVYVTVRRNAGRLAAFVCLVMLMTNTIFITMGSERGVYTYTMWASAMASLGILLVFEARRAGGRVGKLLLYVAAGLSFCLAALSRESMYFAVVAYVFYLLAPPFEKWVLRWSLPVRLALLFGAVVIGVLGVFVIPFARNTALDFLAGRGNLMNVSYLQKYLPYVIAYFMFYVSVASIWITVRCRRADSSMLRAVGWAPLVVAVVFSVAALSPWRENAALGYIAIGWFLGITVIVGWFMRKEPVLLPLTMILLNFTPSLLVLGWYKYFLESLVLSIIAAGVLLGHIFGAISLPARGVWGRRFLWGGVFAVLLAMAVYSQKTTVTDVVDWRTRVAKTMGGANRDFNLVSDMFRRKPESRRQWDFVITAKMREGGHNHLQWTYPVAGLAGYRLLFPGQTDFPIYSRNDFVIPFPYGELGKLCTSVRTERLENPLRTFHADLRKGEVLVGARISDSDPRNLYNGGAPLAGEAAYSPLARRIAVKPGHLYMLGATCKRRDANTKLATILVYPYAPLHEGVWSNAFRVTEEEEMVFSYVMPFVSTEVVFDPQPVDPQAQARANMEVSRPFFVDVTVRTADQIVAEDSDLWLGELWIP